MASEISKERIYGNFKNRNYKRETSKNSENYKSRPGMCDNHLDNLRQLPCCVCFAATRSQVHHLKSGTGERGMGQRSTDRWGVPICPHDHDAVERVGTRNEVSWFARHGIDPHNLAMSLWMARGDVERMRKIVKAIE